MNVAIGDGGTCSEFWGEKAARASGDVTSDCNLVV
jgi:hypothetical protein